MISNDVLQAAWISKLKSITAIVNELSSEDEIKEDQWQGTTFTYPAVRVALGTQTPIGDPECRRAEGIVTIQVFTEDGSSKNADRIAGIINTALYGKAFVKNGVRFSMVRTTGLVPAFRKDERTWQSEVVMLTKFGPVS